CAARTGAGSGASHLITGHGAEHELLEEELAAFTHRERALVFSTGYMANLAVLATLAGRGERVLLDRLSHASLIDGARLSGAELRRYPHADAGAAARLLARSEEHTSELQSRENLVCRLLYPLSLHDALPISSRAGARLLDRLHGEPRGARYAGRPRRAGAARSTQPRLAHRRRAALGRGAQALPPRRRRRRGAPAG